MISMIMLRVSWALGVTLAWVIIGVVRGWLVRSELPERMASHFGAAGRADAYQAVDQFLWLYFALCALTLGALALSVLLVRRLPSRWFNMPDKEAWLAAGRFDEARSLVARVVANMTWITALFLWLCFEFVLYANRTDGNLPQLPFLLSLVAYFGFNIFAVAWMLRRLRFER